MRRWTGDDGASARATWKLCPHATARITASLPRCRPACKSRIRPSQARQGSNRRHQWRPRQRRFCCAAAASTAVFGRAWSWCLFLAVRLYWLATSVQPARLVQVVQLTQTGRIELGNGVATDGTRVYFTQRDGDRWSLAQVSGRRWDTLCRCCPVEEPLTNPDRPWRYRRTVPIYSWPAAPERKWSGPSGWCLRWEDRRAAWGTWRDTRAPGRATAATSCSHAAPAIVLWWPATAPIPESSWTLPGIPYSIRWAPPSTSRHSARFSLLSKDLGPRALWEISADGTDLHSFSAAMELRRGGTRRRRRWQLDRQWELLLVPRAAQPRVEHLRHPCEA